jgi:epsilon-lactone hydrolase
MASLGARALRLALRVTRKIPGARTIASPHFVRRYRRFIGRTTLLFGRLPRGLTRAAVEDRASGVRGEWVLLNAEPNSATVVYYLHGGGFVAGSPATYRSITGAFCRRCAVRVFALDYRLAPEHRFPAAVEDAVAGYRWLLATGISPRQIVVAGDSAGGGLALSMLLTLRDNGEPLPAGAVLIAPWVDLAATLVTSNRGERRIARAYVGDGRFDDPLASGIYADLHGLPPMTIQASTIETLRDDAVRLDAKARAAGTDSTLRLWEGVPHVWHIFAGLPESREAFAEIAAFIARVTQA